jgi:hypothetical protein
MAYRTRYRRKAPSSPEVQGLFFNKGQAPPAFFNPPHATSDRSADTASSVATPVVQRQEGTISPAKPEEEKPVQKQMKEEEKPVQKQTKEEEKPVQKQAKEEEKPVEKPVQKQTKEEEPPVQKQVKEEEKPVQKQDKPEEEKPVQKQAQEEEQPMQKQGIRNFLKPVKAKASPYRASSTSEEPEAPVSLPDRLKTAVEALSGVSMQDVKVHYNSARPIHMQALAYTQGTDIYLAPGQEKHLPHEVWHVVQQKQGRVPPTLQAKGVNMNDDPGLEQEATVMGQKVSEQSSFSSPH